MRRCEACCALPACCQVVQSRQLPAYCALATCTCLLPACLHACMHAWLLAACLPAPCLASAPLPCLPRCGGAKHAVPSTCLFTLSTTLPAAPPRARAGWESELLDLVNAARAEHGLGGLCLNSKLMAAAQAHSADQAANQDMSHDGSDGSSSGDRAKRAGYAYRSLAENVSARVCMPPCCTAPPCTVLCPTICPALTHLALLCAAQPCPAPFCAALHAALRAPHGPFSLAATVACI